MKKIVSLLALVLLCTASPGQNFSLQYETGIGQYSMKEMKDLQLTLKNMVSELGVKSVVRFPATLYYGIAGEYQFDKTNALGVQLFYNTTAGRNHVADYSGEYKMDMLLSSYATGINYRFTFRKIGRFKLSACLGAGMRYSDLKIKEGLTVYKDTVLHSEFKATGNNFYAIPALEVSYPLLSQLDLKLKAGYEYDFRSKYVTLDDSGNPQILYNEDGKYLNVDYSGLRVGLSISYKLPL